MATKGIVKGIVSNLVTVEVDGPVSQNEICYISVGGVKLMSEVIKVIGKNAFVQVFESTRGMRVGDEAEFQGHMLEVTLGPGMLSRNYDGLQNDLDKMEGVFLKRGDYTFALDNDKKWDFKPLAKAGDTVSAGDWLGEVDENFQPHKIMVPFKFEGSYTVKSVVPAGQYTINDTMAVLTDENGTDVNVTMIQKWPVKKAITCYKEKPRPFKLLETGVRTIDTVNPIVEGGTGFIPGPFGTGKTVLQHAISKQAEADIVIIAACGERANEVVEVFTEFPELVDPHTGRKLMERTIIIANTSNMPVAAREASVYTAMTIAEYYRSMGLKVLLMADSTSRWAEALRELSGRLEEMPAEEGFPAYLASRLSSFYERAGMMRNLNGTEGSVTIIGAVSPQGGDFSEPVTQNTKRFVRCFWGLDKNLSYARHFPAIHWLTSYSEYVNDLSSWYIDNVDKNFVSDRNRLMALLTQESSLMEIVKLIGADVLPDDQKLVLEIAKVIRVGFLQQNAFHKDDTSVPLTKQFKMMETILYLYKKSKALIAMGMPMSVLKEDKIFDKIISIKYDVPNDRLDMFDDYKKQIDAFYEHVLERNA
mgnify:CR=1 FL=1